MKPTTLLRVAICSLVLGGMLVLVPMEAGAKTVDDSVDQNFLKVRRTTAAGIIKDAADLTGQPTDPEKIASTKKVNERLKATNKQNSIVQGPVDDATGWGQMLGDALSKAVAGSFGGFGSGPDVVQALSAGVGKISENGVSVEGFRSCQAVATPVVTNRDVPRAKLLAQPIVLATPISGEGDVCSSSQNKNECKNEHYQNHETEADLGGLNRP